MVLALSELTGYLLDRRHIPAEAVLDGGLVIVDTSSRHCNAMVRADPAVGLFVKQGRPDPVQPVAGWTGSGTTAHEAAVYDLLGALPVPVPHFLGFDPEHGLLVLELLPDATNLISYHARTRRFPVTLGTRLGAALAALHDHATGPARDGGFHGRPPWALMLDRPGTGFYRQMSQASLELVRIIQSSPPLRAELASLRDGWRDDAFVHDDVKLDNCLVVPAGRTGRHTRLVLVDWELAGLGDACWDTGSVFASYLHHWLISFPVTGSEEPDHYLGQARYPLERMHPAMRAFWTTYCDARGWDAATADDALIRSVRYAGARLLQTACERTKFLPRVSTVVIALTQLAENVLARPGEAAEQLLGVSPRGRTR